MGKERKERDQRFVSALEFVCGGFSQRDFCMERAMNAEQFFSPMASNLSACMSGWQAFCPSCQSLLLQNPRLSVCLYWSRSLQHLFVVSFPVLVSLQVSKRDRQEKGAGQSGRCLRQATKGKEEGGGRKGGKAPTWLTRGATKRKKDVMEEDPPPPDGRVHRLLCSHFFPGRLLQICKYMCCLF